MTSPAAYRPSVIIMHPPFGWSSRIRCRTIRSVANYRQPVAMDDVWRTGPAKGGPMTRPTPSRIGWEDLLILMGMTAVIGGTTFLVHSPADVPLVDDWTYAWSVQHYLDTRTLRILEWSVHYPLAQILWG